MIVNNLMFPTAMTFGPDGNLYISDTGFGPPAGQILKVEIKDNKDYEHHRHDDHHYDYHHNYDRHGFNDYKDHHGYDNYHRD